MSDDGLTLRERKKSRTRDELLEAALSLFEERGFAATTVEDIAERAAVAPRTFFRYFPDKASVLRPTTDTFLELFGSLLADAPADESPLATVHRALRGMLVRFADDRDRLILKHRIATEADLDHSADEFAGLWRAFEAAIADHLGTDPADDPRPTLLTGVAVAVTASTAQRWFAGGATGDLAAIVDDAFAQLGLLGGPGATAGGPDVTG